MRPDDTLRGRALLANTEHINSLGEVLRACNQNQIFRDTCSDSEYFWKETLYRFVDDLVVEQRGDLVGGRAWEEFASNLATGVIYTYSVWENNQTGVVKLPLRPLYDSYEEDDRMVEYHLEIPGQIPSPESFGYVYTIHYRMGSSSKGFAEFVMHVDPLKAFESCLRMTCEKIEFVSNAEKAAVLVYDYKTGWKLRRPQTYYGWGVIIDNGIYADSIDVDAIYSNLIPEVVEEGVPPRINQKVTIIADASSDINRRVTMIFDINIHPIRF